MGFDLLVAGVAVLAGGIASIAGFGIGSLLTPLVASEYGMKSAVAIVSVPHVIATVLRFWKLRRDVNWHVFVSFGLLNAGGALVGALIHVYITNPVLSTVLGALLVFAGLIGLTGLADRMRFGGKAASIGIASGAFGGLVGNQGGIRSAAMLGLHVQGAAFVATGTAIALAVDAVRMPVYFATASHNIIAAWPVLISGVVGVVAGTLAGERALRRIPEKLFRRIVSAILLAIGTALLVTPHQVLGGQSSKPRDLPLLLVELRGRTAFSPSRATRTSHSGSSRSNCRGCRSRRQTAPIRRCRSRSVPRRPDGQDGALRLEV